MVAGQSGRGCADRRGDDHRLPRLEGQLGLARLAGVELALSASRPLPGVALEQPEPPASEHRVSDLQRLRELPRRSRLLADPVLLLPEVARHGGARDVDRAPLRRREGRDRDVRCVRELCGARALGRGRRDLRPDVRCRLALPPGRHAARCDRRPLGEVQPGDHPVPGRNADHPRVRVPDPGRDPLLGRSRAPRW